MTPRARFPALTLFALALFAHAACAPQDVVVADVSLPDAAPPPPALPPCVRDEDCAADAFCARDRCDAPVGRCAILPLSCDAAQAPACGCDGITYWNDCLRKTAGVTASTPGQCETNAATCGGADMRACPSGASCARLYPPGPRGCDPSGAGVCWVLPAACPDEPPTWVPCGPVPPPTAPPPPCVATCTAIRLELPHTQAAPGEACR